MIYLLTLICLVLPSYLIRFSVFGVPTTMLEVLIYIAAIITIILKLKTKNEKPQLKIKNYWIPIILFLLAGIISVVIAPDKQVALGLFKAYIVDPVFFFFVLIYNVKNKEQIGLLIKALIASAILVSFHAIWQKLTGQLTPDGRVVGVFGYSSNYLALYLAPITVLVISYCLSRVKSRELLVIKKNLITLSPYILTILLLAYTLFLSASRAAIGAVVIGVISYLVISYWDWIKAKKIIVFLFLCFSVLLLILGWFLTKPDWQASSDSGRISSSNNIRWEIWKTTGEIIKQKPLLGTGLGNYQNYFTELTKDRVNYPEFIAPRALTPHNLFLNIWVNLGLLGLIAFIWLLVLFFRYATRLPAGQVCDMRYAKDNQLVTCHLLLVTMMITIIIQGLVDTPYWKNDLAVMFWLFLGLAIINKNILFNTNEKNH